ncbi:MAG: hypothetical protein N2512_01005 [Armatimonadetes bacterium]|nr:hypothetical protein [Armatimonadota bacterium]
MMEKHHNSERLLNAPESGASRQKPCPLPFGHGFRFIAGKLSRVQHHMHSGEPYAFFPLPPAPSRRQARRLRNALQQAIKALARSPLLLKAAWDYPGGTITRDVLFARNIQSSDAITAARNANISVILTGQSLTACLVAIPSNDQPPETCHLSRSIILGEPEPEPAEESLLRHYRGRPERSFRVMAMVERGLPRPEDPMLRYRRGFRALSLAEQELLAQSQQEPPTADSAHTSPLRRLRRRRQESPASPGTRNSLPNVFLLPTRTDVPASSESLFIQLFEFLVTSDRLIKAQKRNPAIHENQKGVNQRAMREQYLTDGIGRVFPALLKRIVTSECYAIIPAIVPGDKNEGEKEVMQNLRLAVLRLHQPFIQVPHLQVGPEQKQAPAFLVVGLQPEKAMDIACDYNQQWVFLGQGPRAEAWFIDPGGLPHCTRVCDIADLLPLPDLSSVSPVTIDFGDPSDRAIHYLVLDCPDHPIFSREELWYAQRVWHRFGHLMTAYCHFPRTLLLPFLAYGYSTTLPLTPLNFFAFYPHNTPTNFGHLLAYWMPFVACLAPAPDSTEADWTFSPPNKFVRKVRMPA